MRKQVDLHVLRKLRLIPLMMEICKRVQICRKSEIKQIGKVLEYVIKIVNQFC